MKMLSIEQELKSNSYPGRGIILGKSEDGTKAVAAYFIMGRSENSRNRVFVEEGQGIRTQAFDPSKLTDPSLIIYAPVRVLGNKTIVTNGDQTDTIYEGMDKQMTFEQSLRSREFEPDGPNYTPRISGIMHLENGTYNYAMSILKSNNGNPDACNRYTFAYENPVAGEVLALVSTPAYDDNEFILGMSGERWDQLNNDENKPLYNRFRQVWCPGSSFKPITAGIGLTTGTINPDEDYGSEGLSWQKDESWGDYHVTTLHEYSPVNLENALIYSDNIYFAKAALNIGADNLMKSLKLLGFGQELPFEIKMSQSQYANDGGTIDSEIQLADSGYGQGQILINPLHLATLYTSILNDGNVIRPYLTYSETPKSEVWIAQAFSSDAASRVKTALEKVVNTPEGTGYGAHREDIALAGKTGTAEIKADQNDTTGTELGWFGVFTEDAAAQKPVLLMSMVEDVKDRGGSGYVVDKSAAVLQGYLP